MTEPQDDILVERAKAGDRLAFDELYSKYKRPILNFVFRLIGNRDTAEEITQEVFIKVYMNIITFDPKKGKVSSWIYTIAANLAKNELRDRKYGRQISLDEAIFDEEAKVELKDLLKSDVKGPDELLQKEELRDKIQRTIESIPFKYRHVLILCDIQGLSYEEAARALNCSIGTVASRLSRARAIFIKRFGIDLDNI